MTQELEKRQKQEVGATSAEQMEASGKAYSPDVDIYANNDELVLAVDMPGVTKGDVQIRFDEADTLSIRAKNAFKEPADPAIRQFNIGDYYRAFSVSDEYDKEKVTAKLEDGLLEVRIPKKEQAKPKRIEIKA